MLASPCHMSPDGKRAALFGRRWSHGRAGRGSGDTPCAQGDMALTQVFLGI